MSSNFSKSTQTLVKRSELNELIRTIIKTVNESFDRADEASQKSKHKIVVIDLGNGNVEWTTQVGTLDAAFDQVQQSIDSDPEHNPISYTPAIKEDGFWMLKGSNGKAYVLLDTASENPIVTKLKAKFNLQPEVSEMSTAGAAGPVSTPMAFSKRGVSEASKAKCRIKGCTSRVKVPAETRVGLGGLCAAHVASQQDQEHRSGEHSKMINWIHTGKHELPENDDAGGQIQDPTKQEMLDYLEHIYSGLLDKNSFMFDAEAAIYWYANFHHGGQNTNLYSALSTSQFNPGPMARAPMKGSTERDMYLSLQSRFGTHDEEDEDLLKESFSRPDTIYKDRQGGVDVYWIDNKDSGGKIFLKADNINQYLRKGYEIVDLADADRVNEMTATGDVSGYNIPSAFARKGGSERGVAGSAALGYELTPIGKKEMQRSGDKLI